MIDLAVSLSGPHLDLLLPLFFGTMERHVDLSNIRLHLVNRGMDAKVRNYVEIFALRTGAMIYDVPQKFTRSFGATGAPVNNWSHDAAGVCQWMVEHCRLSDWMFLSHFDLIFKADAIAKFVSMIHPNAAQIGEHWTGLVGYRLDAIDRCGARFDNLDGLRLCRDQYNKWRLRYSGDRRCVGEQINITGLDVCEWMDLLFSLNGWDVVTLPKGELDQLFIHSQCGSAYHGDATKEISRGNAMQALHELGLNPIV